ncbi:glutaredoxin domain-containing protein [Nocardia sp. NPDC060249]|uniref:glutaredoxin domain-containing protein n=1 Tax=Nocardia sp. NPDC060249 TaxID=3347082 RepID=UPI003661C1E8
MITVYTRPDCQPCKATKRKLSQLGAAYAVIDVTKDPEALDLIRDLGYLQAPVIVVRDGGELIHWGGYAPDKLEWAALSLETHEP